MPTGGSGDISYDNVGNLAWDGYSDPGGRGVAMSYNAENLLTARFVTEPFPELPGAEFVYDGNGRRVVVYGYDETFFIYGIDGSLVYESSGGNEGKDHAYLNGELLVTADSENVRWLVKDQLGTPRIVMDKYGNVTRHDYLPFGEEIDPSIAGRSNNGYEPPPQPDGVRQQFTGYERDVDTGLDFAQARYFSSSLGRFYSADQPFLDQWEHEPQSWNLYTYVRNNPLNLVDPTGQRANEPKECPTGKICTIDKDGKITKIEDDTDPIRIDTTLVLTARTRFTYFDRAARNFGHWLRNMFGRPSRPTNAQPPSQPSASNQPSSTNQVYGPPSPARLDMGKQGKHIVGHNNYISGRSILTANPQNLAARAGSGQQVGSTPIGQSGSKERVDFGFVIGYHVTQSGQSSPTTKGTIIYSNSGIHIVPAQP